MRYFLVFLSLLLLPSVAYAKRVIVFDMDRTLMEIDDRIVAIMRDLGHQFGVPQLASFNRSQLGSLIAKDYAKLGLQDPALITELFGDGSHAGLKTSEFGRRFYAEAKWLQYDTPLEGAATFVKRMAQDLDADVLYLTGRVDTPEFRQATLEQLKRGGFPTGTLVLKPANFTGRTEEFKAGVLSKMEVVAVFDDSAANVNKLREVLPSHVLIVHVSRDPSTAKKLKPGIIQIQGYGDEEQFQRFVQHGRNCDLEHTLPLLLPTR